MKTQFNILSIAFVLLMASSMSSCKKKEVAKAPAGEVEILVHCSGPDYFSTKKFFRSNAVGESLDQSTSKKKAMSNAKAELAGAINTTIKATIDNYVNSREFNNQEEVEERFEGLTREVINQEITGTRVICEKVFKTQENKYKTYLAIELSGTDLVAKMNERLSKDERLKIDYDYEKFKETFEKEMEKMEGR